MNRRSFVSILTGMFGAVLAGLGLGKKQKIKDPCDLPWRNGRKSQPISSPRIHTDTPLVAHGPGYVRQPMIQMEDGSTNLPPLQRFVLQNGQYIEVDLDSRVVSCSKPNPNWVSAPKDREEWKLS